MAFASANTFRNQIMMLFFGIAVLSVISVLALFHEHLGEGDVPEGSTGCGISQENLPRIFEPYFTTKEMEGRKGMGLGLAICHSIIKRHGGFISAESSEGKGTIISICLPYS